MAVAFVQGKRTVTVTATTTIAATFDSAVPVGDFIVVGVGWFDGGGATQTISSIVGGAGNTYTPNTLRTSGDGDFRMQSQTVVNVLNAAHTVTVTFSAEVTNACSIWIVHLSGVAATGAIVDQNHASVTTGSSLDAGDVVTTADDGALLSFTILASVRTITRPTGYTETAAATTRSAGAYRLAEAADTYSAVWNWTGGNSRAIAIHDAYRAEPPAAPTTRVLNTLRTRAMNRGVN
jgi:hypothetical protein